MVVVKALFVVCALVACVRADSLNFLAVGDWGGQDTDPYTRPGEIAAAGGMATIATQLNAKFVLGLGDNFYYSGKREIVCAVCSVCRFVGVVCNVCV